MSVAENVSPIATHQVSPGGTVREIKTADKQGVAGVTGVAVDPMVDIESDNEGMDYEDTLYVEELDENGKPKLDADGRIRHTGMFMYSQN